MLKGILPKTKQNRAADRDSAKGPKRTADEVLRDRADIARLRLEGLTQSKIAAEISGLRDYTISPAEGRYSGLRCLSVRNF